MFYDSKFVKKKNLDAAKGSPTAGPKRESFLQMGFQKR